MRQLFTACLLLLPALSFAAGGISHDFVEIQGVYVDPDSLEEKVGGRLRGSVGVTDDLVLFGDYTRAGYEGEDLDIGTLGAGLRVTVSERSDVMLLAAAVRTRAPASLPGGDQTGALVALEVRSRFGEHLDLGTRAGWTRDAPGGNGFMLGMNALWHLNDTVAVSAEALTWSGDVNHFGLGARISF